MTDKKVGTQSRLTGKLDDIGFDDFYINEPDYTMISMSTYSPLVVSYGQK